MCRENDAKQTLLEDIISISANNIYFFQNTKRSETRLYEIQKSS